MTAASNPANASIDVSVVIPTYRREAEVCEAIQSVLQQEGVNVECIVLDDTPEGSARSAVMALNDPRINYIVRPIPSKGRPAMVRNEGAAIARGRYLYFLDDDDHVFEGALRDLSAALDVRPDLGVALGWVVPFGSDPYWLQDKSEYFERAGRIGATLDRNIWFSAHILFRGTLMVNSACMVRRSCFAPLGGFDASIRCTRTWISGCARCAATGISICRVRYCTTGSASPRSCTTWARARRQRSSAPMPSSTATTSASTGSWSTAPCNSWPSSCPMISCIASP
jgi:glycosyltransferase involved in cell wall biosynthesis